MAFGAPIGDFGNYYYGSKLFLNGTFTKDLYTSLHYFNLEIGKFGETNYFENYIPVPPFSALFYSPFCLLKPIIAKFVFNLISFGLFSISLINLFLHLKLKFYYILLVPIVFIYPFYNCVFQGQAYLLITACIVFAFLAIENNRIHIAALLLAFVISLKIFPVFLLLFYALTKKWKVIIYTIFYVIIIYLVTSIFLGFEITIHYFSNVVPRLINNDIIGPYNAVNQSVYSMLLNLFTYDGLVNTQPVFDFPILVPVLESIFIGVIGYLVYSNQIVTKFKYLSFTIIAMCLINRYNTTYSLLLLVPVLLQLLVNFQRKEQILAFILFLSINIPISLLNGQLVMLKFSRIVLLFVFFLLFSYPFQKNYKAFLLFIVPVFLIKYLTFIITPVNYFTIQNNKGILYDIDLKDDTLMLYTTIGEKTLSQSVKLKGMAKFDSRISCFKNQLYYKNVPIGKSYDNKMKPFLFNDTAIVYMSDLNQGVAFYKLRFLSIK